MSHLAGLLAGTAERRAQRSAEIRSVAAHADYALVSRQLASARLLPVLGSRLVSAAPEAVPSSFRDGLDAALSHARRRAALVEQVALSLVRRLEQQGIVVVPIKGPHLAERLYGDAGMRTSNDIDLLVQPEDFAAAMHALAPSGYRSAAKAPWRDGLPLFEASLTADDGWRPPVDLHWRLHWYEQSFSRRFISRCELDERGVRRPQPLDELAALLLFWSRDGLHGLRHAVDVGAWWDRHGVSLTAGALDDIARAHPELRGALGAASILAERSVGVPADRLLSQRHRGGRRAHAAARYANLSSPVTAQEDQANVALMDALLTPRGGAAALVGRHLLLPAGVVAEIYGLPPSAGARRRLRRAYYALRVGARLLHGGMLVARRVLGSPGR